MPVKSRAQQRFFGAVASGKVADVDPAVGKEFLAAPAAKRLPERVKTKRRTAALAGKKGGKSKQQQGI